MQITAIKNLSLSEWKALLQGYRQSYRHQQTLNGHIRGRRAAKSLSRQKIVKILLSNPHAMCGALSAISMTFTPGLEDLLMEVATDHVYILPTAWTKRLALWAVRKNPANLSLIPSRIKIAWPEICRIAISQNPDMIRAVPAKHLSNVLAELAVRQNGLALKHVPLAKRTKRVCMLACQSVPKNFLNFVIVQVPLKHRRACEEVHAPRNRTKETA